ncbi:MAG TPA: filamentous hemagglutinin N-terminal domain-containing protein [Nitrospiria bacterium]|nr:filamentous hemagglutinin N-terminal domain-containing protein [Nitrospiria bacterium]
MRRQIVKRNRGAGRLSLARVSLVLVGQLLFSSGAALANPMGPVVMSGRATITGIGTPVVTIQQGTSKVILNWQSFNIGPTELTRFLQPSAKAMALNRILDQNPTKIFGSLQANGIVLLLNPNGVLFGPNAQVNVNGLVASSLNLTDHDFLNGDYHFTQTSIAGAVSNAGTIQTNAGGFVYLLAPNVENGGIITSPNGQITLAAGSTVYLTDRPDGRGLLVEVQAPTGAATNLKDLIADGGSIDLYGQAINQSGLIQANSVQQQNGQIRLVASDQVNLAAGSLIEARGDDVGVSNGGNVKVTSGQGVTNFETGAVIDVSGGAVGGDAGSVELSGGSINIGGQIVGHAAEGYQGGRLVIDPLIVDQTLLQSALDSGFATGMTDFTFHSDDDLTVSGVTLFFDLLPVSGSISFDAAGDLQFENSLMIFDTGGSFASFNGYIPWDLSLTAGRDVVLQNSLVGTGGGGNLTVTAGRDVISPSVLNPPVYGTLYTGLRLDDLQPGTLTIDAGRDFTGGFVLTSGTANVTVGRNFGSNTGYANLTLGMGNISVNAVGDIYLGLVQDEVLAEGRGEYRGDGSNNLPLLKLADSGNRVDLLSETGSIYLNPHSTQPQVLHSLEYYPTSFSADAPQGSIEVGGNLTFWPSATGSVIFSAQNDIMGVTQNGQTPTVKLVQSDPAALETSDLGGILSVLTTPAPSGVVTTADLAPVRFQTTLGDIHDLVLDLRTPSSLPKAVTIASGHDITSFAGLISAYQCVDGDCPQIISAADVIDMTRPQQTTGVVSGVTFYGNGHGEVVTGSDLNLADSDGVRFFQGTAATPGGLLDLAIGGDLLMTSSRILTYNGASILIRGPQGPDSPTGGAVDVGTDVSLPLSTAIYGILTLGGGDITIRAAGNVEVNKSRVATLSGGNIDISSVHGDISAGSGARNEQVGFVITVLDANGNPVIDPRTGNPVQISISVPGSGIYTFHPSDPNPLPPYPPPPPLTAFMSPVQRLYAAQVLKQAIAGHDITIFKPQDQAAQQQAAKLWSDAYSEIIGQFTKDWKLGDIRLTALEGSVVVPPAGIRGKNILIKAKNLKLVGGAVAGNLIVDVGNISGSLHGLAGPTFGNLGGNFAVPSPTSSSGLSGLSGSTGSLSSTVTTMTASVADTVQDQETKKAEAETAASSGAPGEQAKKKQHSVRLKQGVTIEVEVSPETP